MNTTISQLVALVEKMVAPFEKLAAYFAVGGVGMANFPHLPNVQRAVLSALGALAVIEDRRKP